MMMSEKEQVILTDDEILAQLKIDEEIILNENNFDEYKTDTRPVPKYVEGFLDAPYNEGGFPVRPKDRQVFDAVINGNFGVVEIEGGVRGGKDVIALYAAAKKAMFQYEEIVIVFGNSVTHALRTVLLANGFGFYYTIPHGTFIRDTRDGAQRGIYKFKDAYGFDKEILFYGNDKAFDHEKFQGFTAGMIYVNETLNQHINGLFEADSRVASAKHPLIIMTQNPKGEMADFYQKYEKPKLATDKQRQAILDFQEKYTDVFKRVEFRTIKEKMKPERTSKTKAYLTSLNKYFDSHNIQRVIEALSDSEAIALHKIRQDIIYKWDMKIRELKCQNFDNSIVEGHYLFDKSAKKVIGWFDAMDNPNNIKNAYDFAYFHYTIDDNMSVSEMMRNDFKNKFQPGTSIHDQRVLGIRRSSEGAVFTSFTEKNIFTELPRDFNFLDKERVLVIDPGFNHPTAITDWAVDMNKNIGWCLQERKINFNEEFVNEKSYDLIYDEFLRLVNNVRKRPLGVIIDPSQPQLFQYFSSRGWNVISANNKYGLEVSNKEVTAGHDKIVGEMIGIPLIQLAFTRLKLFINSFCVNMISEIESYSFKNTNDGKEKTQDLNDDLVDTMRYFVNTMGFNPHIWEDYDNNLIELDESKEKNEKKPSIPEKELTDEEYVNELFEMAEKEAAGYGYDFEW